MDRLPVIKVTVQAAVTSFRHPFFVVGSQPSFDMPPPSTIHGHCASALGRYPDSKTFFFGVHFTYRSRVHDLEHQNILKPREIKVQPVAREMLFGATLTLYLDPSLEEAFRAPVFPVTLGRSQDLAEVVSVERIELVRGEKVRLEHTLLPRAVRPCVRFGSTVLLTRHISEPPVREATFAQYIVLHEPVWLGGPTDTTRSFDRVEGIDLSDLFTDPSVIDEEGCARGVWIHRLVDAA